MQVSIALAVLLACLTLAGCSSDARMQVEWMDPSHARMTMDHSQTMGNMAGMAMTGPAGPIAMHMWNGTGTCPMGQVASCQMGGMMHGWMMGTGTHVMEMHAMMVDGSPGMVMVPQGMEGPAHDHQAMPHGNYTWTMEGMGTAEARLG